MKRWVIAIVGMLAINVIACVVLAVLANNNDGSRVLPSYHDRPAEAR